MNRVSHPNRVDEDDDGSMPPARPFFRRTPSSSHTTTTSSTSKKMVTKKKYRVASTADGVQKKEQPLKTKKKKFAITSDEKDIRCTLSSRHHDDAPVSSSSSFPAPPRLQRLSPLDELEAEISRSYQHELELLMFGKGHHRGSSGKHTTTTATTNPSPHHHSSPHGLSPSPEGTQQQQQHGQSMAVEDGGDELDSSSRRSESGDIGGDDDWFVVDRHHQDSSVCVNGLIGEEGSSSPVPEVPPMVEDNATIQEPQLQLPPSVTDKLQLYRQLWQQRSAQTQSSSSSPLNITTSTSPKDHPTATTATAEVQGQAPPVDPFQDVATAIATSSTPSSFNPPTSSCPLERVMPVAVTVSSPMQVEEICVEEEELDDGSSSPIDSVVGSITPTAPSVDDYVCGTNATAAILLTSTAGNEQPPSATIESTTVWGIMASPPTSQFLLPPCHHHHHHIQSLLLGKEVVRRLSFEMDEVTTVLEGSHDTLVPTATTTTTTTTTIHDEDHTTKDYREMATPTRPLLFDDTDTDEEQHMDHVVTPPPVEATSLSIASSSAATVVEEAAKPTLSPTLTPVTTPLFNDDEEWCIADGQRTAGEVVLSEMHQSDPPAAASTSPLCVSPLLDPHSWLYNGGGSTTYDVDDRGGKDEDANETDNMEEEVPPQQQFGSLDRYAKWVASSTMAPATPPPLGISNKCGRVLTIPTSASTTSFTTRQSHIIRRRATPSAPRPTQKAPVAVGFDDSTETSFTPEAELRWAATLDVFRDMPQQS